MKFDARHRIIVDLLYEASVGGPALLSLEHDDLHMRLRRELTASPAWDALRTPQARGGAVRALINCGVVEVYTYRGKREYWLTPVAEKALTIMRGDS